MSIVKKDKSLPSRSCYIAHTAFIEETGIDPSFLEELLALGWISPRRTQENECLFCAADVYRVRKLGRICSDFELPLMGGTIIVDLLERVDALEKQVRYLQEVSGK